MYMTVKDENHCTHWKPTPFWNIQRSDTLSIIKNGTSPVFRSLCFYKIIFFLSFGTAYFQHIHCLLYLPNFEGFSILTRMLRGFLHKNWLPNFLPSCSGPTLFDGWLRLWVQAIVKISATLFFIFMFVLHVFSATLCTFTLGPW